MRWGLDPVKLEAILTGAGGLEAGLCGNGVEEREGAHLAHVLSRLFVKEDDDGVGFLRQPVLQEALRALVPAEERERERGRD